ncbi:hypothetical protein CARUB_v10025201mg, partial [Capsella rubella]
GTPLPNLYLPRPVLAKVISNVAANGVEDLKNWIKTGKEGKIAVLSPETLAAVRGLYLAFKACNIQESIEVLGSIKDIYPVSEVAYYMLQSCAGCLKTNDLCKLKSKYPYEDISRMGDALMFHIYSIGPRRLSTYSNTWFNDFPWCWEHHDALRENNCQRCMDCIYYYLSRDILLLS